MNGRRRLLIINSGLLVVVVGLVLFGLDTIFHKSSAQAAARTATVSTGTVSSSVTATGNVAAAQSQSVAFTTGGTINAIDVAAGQTVTAGQILATLDPAAARASLTAAEDNLVAAQDNLALVNAGGETPPQVAQDNFTLANATSAVGSAQTNLTTAQQTAATDTANLEAAAKAAQAKLNSDQKACTGHDQTACGLLNGDAAAVNAANNTESSTEAKDAQGVSSAQSALTQALNGRTSDQLSVNAKRYVNPAAIAQDNGAVTSAEAAVTQAQKAFDETTLSAPYAGVITTLTGTVGQVVAGGGSSTSSSAGSSGSSSSGTGTSATGGSGAAATSASTGASSSSSSSAILTIADMSGLQVVAGFAEADASKIALNQPATVTVSALPGVSVTGKVTAVSSLPSVVSNVVTYSETISLTSPPSSVRIGMTAQVQVVVNSVANTLELPSAAVTSTGRVSTVRVMRNGKQVPQVVTVGLRGDTTTQITAGLSSGDVVVIPSAQVTGTTGTRATTGTGLGGLTGGGLTGGGGGAFTGSGSGGPTRTGGG